jgi:hypothetical protein
MAAACACGQQAHPSRRDIIVVDAATALADRIVATRARRDPSWATSVGIRGHDHELRRSDAGSFAEELAEVEAFLVEARALDPGVRRDALVGALEVEAFELSTARTWARDPDLAAAFFDHLLGVLLAPHLTRDEKLAALAGRLEGCARFFGDGWSRFEPAEVPSLWVDGARESSSGAVAFLDAMRAFAAGAPEPLATRIADALAGAEGTIAAHDAWLRALAPRAHGTPSLGSAALTRLLRIRGFREHPDELVALGERLRDRFRAEMEEVALTVLAEAGRSPGDDPVAEAMAVVKQDHPATFEEALALYRSAIEESRAAVIALGLVTPTEVPLDVVETPAFLRHLVPFAAYVGPPRFATPRRGTYLVTPKVDLEGFPRADVRNTTVHEAWPGHHLQLSIAADRAPSWAWLADAVDHVEGWALYCEALMGERGFTASPQERLVRARDALWRAVRIVLDVGIHTGVLSPSEAAARLARETGMTREEAEAEVLRYALEPGYNLSYMMGRLAIEEMRERALARGGDLRSFHDAFLAAGPLPVVLSSRLLGWGQDIRQG